MLKPRVLLLSSQHLFGESMEMILRTEQDMELVGPWKLDEPEICQRLTDVQPSIIVIADEDLNSEAAAELTRVIIEKFPELSVIRTGLSENVFRIFSTHTVPARGADLRETIRSSVVRSGEAKRTDDLHHENNQIPS